MVNDRCLPPFGISILVQHRPCHSARNFASTFEKLSQGAKSRLTNQRTRPQRNMNSIVRGLIRPAARTLFAQRNSSNMSPQHAHRNW